ncbi:MAG: hypothetical protein UW11_C0047G0006 [Parcubacteria group bacterium GW2011_GWA2_43_9b]|nr:MAG: hypothetical protein UW11_C0047G0006 [Parcubacteria group bacterium GW2011_GWA2_43_9b]
MINGRSYTEQLFSQSFYKIAIVFIVYVVLCNDNLIFTYSAVADKDTDEFR